MSCFSLTLELQAPTTFAIRSGSSALHCLLQMQQVIVLLALVSL